MQCKLQKTVFTNIEEVQVPEQYYPLIWAHYYMNKVRILLFCSPDIKEKLCHIYHSFFNTFKSHPRPFVEWYSILGDTGSTTNMTKELPLIFALLSYKKVSNYEKYYF